MSLNYISKNIKGMYDVGAISQDASKATEFYARLGFKRDHQKEGLTVFVVGNVELAIRKEIPNSEMGPLVATVLGSVSFGVIVEDIKMIAKRLETQGIHFVGPKPFHAGFTGIDTKDSDGNIVRLFQEEQ